MSKLMIECHELGKRYQEADGPNSLWAVRDLTLGIKAGSVTLLMGPSGSGKTTLLSMIGGLLQPTRGWLAVHGTPLDRCSEKQRQVFRRRYVGYIFQNYNLLSALTAEENVGVALSLRGQNPSEAVDYLALVGMEDKRHAFASELSGGQRQRVAIARALAGATPILLADEPTAALDSEQGQAIMELIRRQAKRLGTTVLIVTHDPRITKYADCIIEMEDGMLERQRDLRKKKVVPAVTPTTNRPRFSQQEVVYVAAR